MYGLALILAFFSIGSVIDLNGHEHRSHLTPHVAKDFTVADTLEDLGGKYDRYFTIEEGWKEGESWRQISSRTTGRSRGRDNVFQELDELRASVPHFIYRRDKRNARIIHISDDRLGQNREYALDRIIKGIDFSGLVFDLVNSIGGQGINVSSRGPMGTEEFMTADRRTSVHVKGKGLKVRDALTDFIPLKGRASRILWIAETKLGPSETTYVRYQGAAR